MKCLYCGILAWIKSNPAEDLINVLKRTKYSSAFVSLAFKKILLLTSDKEVANRI